MVCILVVGASQGGAQAPQTLVSALPKDDAVFAVGMQNLLPRRCSHPISRLGPRG